MLLADSLVVIGMATASLGTIHEADGVKEHSFWLRNAGQEAVALQQGYTSCGCTTIHFAQGARLQPGDSSRVTLRFNPRGKGGEFHEVGTIEYGKRKKRINLTLTGNCVTSEETLLRQFPVRINENLRLSTDHFDLGRMRIGETKERTVVVLQRDKQDRKVPLTIRYQPDGKKRGLQHIDYPLKIRSGGKEQLFTVHLDVFIL